MKLLTSYFLFAVGFVATASADEARLLRFPTTNGTDVVFTYAGDLYKAPLSGGEAVRLTSYVGYEIFPRLSPDGHTIAFTGQYDGNTEVYSMDINGGEPQRLTYTATNHRDDLGDRMGPNNIVLTWAPDGNNIVYRNRLGDGFPGELWTISPKGGMSQQIPLPEGGFCSYSPDGKKLAYNRVMREFRTWKYYKGGMADDIWVYDTEAQKVDKITDNVSQDICPMWIGNEIFFISDRDRTMNLFSYNMKTKATTKVTDFKEYDIKFPSSNGQWIVFENGGYIYKFNPETRKTEKLTITLNADNVQARPFNKNVARNVTNVSLSADGQRLAVTARGEVFSVPAKEGVTKNITSTPGSHDRNAVWSPDNRYIVYIADGTGETELMLWNVETGETKQITEGNDTYIRQMKWSPDSKTVLYSDRKNRLVSVAIPSGNKRVLLTDSISEFYNYAFSPDSKWLTYTRQVANTNDVVYLYNLSTGVEYPVTEKWYSSAEPTFSQDGKYLVFASARDFQPKYGWLEWNHIYTNMYGIYMALLSKDTPSPFLAKDDVAVINDDSASKASAKKTDKKVDKKELEEKIPAVKFDADGIADRIVKLPLEGGSYDHFYMQGDMVYYAQNNTTYAYDLKKKKADKVTDGKMYDATAQGKALFVKDNKFFVTNLPGASLTDAVDMSRVIAPVDYKQEWAQLFDEAWRAYRDGFYLENMHGVDWKSIKTKYEVLLPYAKTRLDVNYLIGEMIGELCCGHCYVSATDYERASRVMMGLLGAKLSADAGFYRIDKIYEGASYSSSLRSPLKENGLNVKEGDYIVAIDGVPTNTVQNIYSLLVGKANVMVELSINNKPTLEGARKIVVKSIDDEYPLAHYAWVQNNIKTVEKLSDGKIGYVYVPDMGPDGLNEFARYFYAQLDKEALIIDDRANGGGNVSPMLLERLCREVYRVTMRRNSSLKGTVPEATLHGPKACLVNKYSASDGDLFPWGFRANGLGKIIGTRTWGGIVGISGSLPYMDGTDIRVPFFTCYDPKTGEWIIENHGVDPDILIDNDPIKEWKGEDQQLEKAVEVLMEEIKTRKPLPNVPAPRDFSK